MLTLHQAFECVVVSYAAVCLIETIKNTVNEIKQIGFEAWYFKNRE